MIVLSSHLAVAEKDAMEKDESMPYGSSGERLGTRPTFHIHLAAGANPKDTRVMKLKLKSARNERWKPNHNVKEEKVPGKDPLHSQRREAMTGSRVNV